MTKKPSLIFLLSLAWVCGLTQGKEVIDNLHDRLAGTKDDTSRINVWIELCTQHRLGNADSSLYYGNLALEASRTNKYPAGEILALSFMSIPQEEMGNLPKALEMAFTALQIGKQNDLEPLTSPALNAIGEVYIILKDYPKALHYLQQERLKSEMYESIEGLGYAFYDIGVVYEQTNRLDSAMFYEQLAINTFARMKREEPLVYKTVGDIHLKSGNKQEALSNYQKSLQIAIANNERRASGQAYYTIARFYKLLNKPDSGIYYALNALKVAQSISQKKTIMESTALLSDFYELIDPQRSLEYLRTSVVYKDSLFGAGNLQAIEVLADQQEEYQKQIINARAQYKNQLRQYAFLTGLVILLLIAGILYRNNRQKQKANSLLRQQKEKVETTLSDLKATQQQLIQSEKMASLGELTAGIAHEIQNPLNFVNNFSEINKELVDELKSELTTGNGQQAIEIADSIKANEEKINHHGKRADAIVKGMLQHSRTSNGQKEPTDINALVDEYLRLAYHGLKAKEKSFDAQINTDFENSIGMINIIPQDIGRVILNLINNAFYAVEEKKKQNQDGYEPTVSISTKKAKDKVEIKVKDNGNGIPQKVLDKIFQPFFTTKPTGQGTGLGLSLAYDIVKAHGGEIKVNTKENEGTEFIIELPNQL